MTRTAAFESPLGHGVAMLRFPYPYRAMLAISSDIDLTSIHRLRANFRFINTREDTPNGPGLGLDFADSFWMMSVFKSEVRSGREVAYWWLKDGLEKTPYAEELAEYAKAGWLDTLHSYGNFCGARKLGVRFERRHAEAALEQMAKLGLVIPVWTNHGDQENRQNIGDAAFMQGDDPDCPAYHADLMIAAGVRFIDRPQQQSVTGLAEPLDVSKLADGRAIYRFPRMKLVVDDGQAHRRALSAGGHSRISEAGRSFTAVWTANMLNDQLSPRVLDHIVENGLFLTVAQHMGAQGSLPNFDAPAVKALHRLASYQDDGRILVARTSRLLAYAANLKAAEIYTLAATNGAPGPVIDIASLGDVGNLQSPPTLDDVRGFSFKAPPGARVALAGRAIDENALCRTPTDDGQEIVAVAWHAPNTTDFTADFANRRRYVEVAGYNVGVEETAQLNALNSKACAWLEAARETRFKEADAQEQYALDYSVGRFKVGLAHYGDVMGKLGFTGRRYGLDIGSGAGHWVHAFAALNEKAAGLEPRADFVEIANGVGDALGFGDRARSVVGDGHALPYEDAAFDTVLSHGVIMFLQHDQAFMEMSRVLEPHGLAYVGYTALGHRLAMLDKVASGEGTLQLRRRTIAVVFNQALHRIGLNVTPGGKARCFTREELQHVARYAGFNIVGAPQLQDLPQLWRGYEGTIDFLAEKTMSADERAQSIAAAAADDDALIDAAQQATDYGAPLAALKILDAGDLPLDPKRPKAARTRIAAMLKAGRLKRNDPSVEVMAGDRTPMAFLLRAKIALNFGDWAGGLTHLERLDPTATSMTLAAAAKLNGADPVGGRAAAEAAVESYPEDFAARAALLRALHDAADEAALSPEIERFLADLTDLALPV